MFSFRNTFLLAAAALATVASAAPTGPSEVITQPGRPGLKPIVNVKDILRKAGLAVKRNPPEQTINGQPQGINAAGLGSIGGLLAGLTNGLKTRDEGEPHGIAGIPGLGVLSQALNLGHGLGVNDDVALASRDEVTSLPALLTTAQTQLGIALATLNTVSLGKTDVDVQVLVDIVEQVKSILVRLLDGVKALLGQPAERTLAVDGEALDVTDMSLLLTNVLSLVCIILFCVLRLVASASLPVISPLVEEVGAALCKLLPDIFTLVPGLGAALAPTIEPIIAILTALKLNNVVAILKDAH